MAKMSEVDKKLVSILRMIDVHIDDRKKGLEIRKSMANSKEPDLWVQAGADVLNAWQGARNYILAEFPHLREKYNKKK